MNERNTILVVDDDPDDVMLTLRAFEQTLVTSETVVACTGTEALDYLLADERRDDGKTPAVVLLDLKMPGMDGLEVLRRIRADTRTRSLPVVVMTSSRDARDRASAYAGGANSYVQKPVEFHHMVELARTLATYWLVMNQPDESREGV